MEANPGLRSPRELAKDLRKRASDQNRISSQSGYRVVYAGQSCARCCVCAGGWGGGEEGDNKDAERAGGKRGAIPEGCYSYLQGPLGQMPKASLFLLTATCCPQSLPQLLSQGTSVSGSRRNVTL